MRRRLLLITNPAAARTSRSVLADVCATLEADGFGVTVAETKRAGHAVDLARDGVRDHVDVIAVYGGDGTIMQAVEGMRGSGVPLALIPGGTGNLLVGNLRLPRNPRRAARLIASGSVRTVDLGRFESNGVVRYFAVACGAGFDADLMARTSGPAKARWGMAAYVACLVRMIPNIVPRPYRITVDDRTLDIEAVSVMVANCREIVPPVLGLGDTIQIDDGQIDLIVLQGEGILQAIKIAWRLFRQSPDGDSVTRLAGRRVRVEVLSGPQVAQLDGEADAVTPFEASILPGELSVIVPGS